MDRVNLLSFIEQAPVAVAMFDREMRYIVVSQRWLSERNLDRSIIGRTAYEVYPDVDAKFRDMHLRALSGETIAREEDYLEVAHGRVQWVRSEMRPWYDHNAQIGGILIYAEDITAQKIAEQSLRKSEERFRYAMEAARDGIWDWNLKTDQVAYSPAFREMLGYEGTEWDSGALLSIVDLLHPEDQESIPRLARNLLHSPGRYELEFRIRHKDGSYRYILSRGKTVEWDAKRAPIRAVGTHTDITERKAIEDALRQREEVVRRQHEELEAIYQNAPIGLASYDRKLRYQRINKRLAEIIGGLPQTAYIGRTILDTTPAMASVVEKAARAALAGRKLVAEREIAGETPAQPGITRYFKDHWYPVFDGAGQISGCGIVVDEITETKQIALRLQQASERLELAQSAANIGIWEWNLLNDEAVVNDQWRLIFGVAADVSLSYDDFVSQLHPADREAFTGMVNQAFSGSGNIDGESRIIRADNGETRWVASKGKIFFDGQKPIRAMGAVWDITQFKQAQEILLQRSEDRYQRIVEAAQEGIWLLDANAKTSFVNPRMAWLLGYEKDEMLGRELLDFVDDEWRFMAEQKLIDRESGVIETHDFKFRRKNGADLWALLSCVPIFEGGVYQGALAMVMDFTERKRLEEDRRIYLEDLKQMDRRKDEFLATLGHELRTPLATIALAMDVIESDVTLTEKSRVMCMRTQRQVRHLKRIVEDILQVSRLSMGTIDLHLQRLDLGHLLAQVKDSFEARFEERGISLATFFSEEVLLVDADEVRLTQTFGNLLDNAVKYTDSGGAVDLSVVRQGDRAVIAIRDTGIGIPKERLAWIFHLFNRMKHGPERARDGIGVGLALARKIVELHGGDIEARSEGRGKGSEFIVRLPLISATD